MNDEPKYPNETAPTFHRFQLFQGRMNENGKIEKTKGVGMAYHVEGQENYTIKLWTYLAEHFYLVPNHRKAGGYFVMTREANKNPNAKSKYFWNIVGSGKVLSALGVIELEFDLFSKAVYMNIFPESQPSAANLADFKEDLIAA
jgi:hypothetical protein